MCSKRGLVYVAHVRGGVFSNGIAWKILLILIMIKETCFRLYIHVHIRKWQALG